MKKKLMILLVVTLFITMMFSSGCKKKFDIQGTWKVYTELFALPAYTITFTGSKTSGIFSLNGEKGGTYTVNGKNITWIYTNGTTYTGTSTDDNKMSGTIKRNADKTGTWTAVRK